MKCTLKIKYEQMIIKMIQYADNYVDFLCSHYLTLDMAKKQTIEVERKA